MITHARCPNCKKPIKWEVSHELWEKMRGWPTWALGFCPHCKRAFFFMLNTQLYGDPSGVLLVDPVQGDSFYDFIPWKAIKASGFFVDVMVRDPD